MRWAIGGWSLPGIFGFLHPVVASAADAQARNSWQELRQLNIGRFGCKAHDIDGQRAKKKEASADPYNVQALALQDIFWAVLNSNEFILQH